MLLGLTAFAPHPVILSGAKNLLLQRLMIVHLPENKLPLIFLNDNQAVWVEDKKMEIISL